MPVGIELCNLFSCFNTPYPACPCGTSSSETARHASDTGNPPYSISPYSAVKRYSGKGDTTLHAPPLRSAGRISSGAARGYHLVAVPPLDLGAMLTADRP
jgi:hypothetical protein